MGNCRILFIEEKRVNRIYLTARGLGVNAQAPSIEVWGSWGVGNNPIKYNTRNTVFKNIVKTVKETNSKIIVSHATAMC